MSDPPSVRIHPTADVSPDAEIGAGTRIWNDAQVREHARIGSGCVIGKNVYVDFGVAIGDNVKIQNNSSLFHGVTIEDGVFVGPHVCLTNDRLPRAINTDGSAKTADDWTVGPIVVRYGAALGASSVVLPGITIGRWALVGAGSVVTRDVPDYGLVAGNPARRIGSACRCGQALPDVSEGSAFAGPCPSCGEEFPPAEDAAGSASAARVAGA
jgi:acetyltransferase-like isoleucine patch superfamily enzyme